MQNNDLIPRKEVEKMIETSCFEDDRDQSDLLEKLSQIESVNGWIAFDDETPKDWTDIVCTDFTSYATAEVDDWDLIFEYECDIEFTHYMPLPPPPIINKV